MKTQKETAENNEEKKPRKRKPYPTSSFEESYELAKEVYKLGVGQKVRRLTVFDALKKSPDSGPSRMLVTSANKYGLVTGGYQAEFLELTQKGKEATSDEVSEAVRSRAKFQLAVENIEIYKKLYDKFVDAKLPNLTVMKDILMELEAELEDDEASTVVDTFVVNIRFLGLLQTIAGAERLISIDHSLEKLPAVRQPSTHTVDLVEVDSTSKQIAQFKNFDNDNSNWRRKF